MMRHSIGLVTPAEALAGVFLPVTYGPHLPLPRYRSKNSLIPSPRCLFPQPYLHQRRNASVSRKEGNIIRSYEPNSLGLIPNRATAVEDHNRPKRDEEIQSFKVHLVDPESNKLTQPYLLTQVLNSLEKDAKGRREQYLQEVGPMDRMADPPRWFPICKVFNKQKDREKELALKKAARLRKQTTKQLEFSWIMSDNDLDHRLGRLTEFLRKGFRVELLFGVKRKGWVKKRQATSEDIHKVLARTRGAVSEVDGAKEFHAIQREEGGEATWTFEGKKQDRSSQQGQSERDASIGDVKEEKT